MFIEKEVSNPELSVSLMSPRARVPYLKEISEGKETEKCEGVYSPSDVETRQTNRCTKLINANR